MCLLLARTMEVNGVFRSGGDLGMNGRYSFKSLLLDDGDGMDEAAGQIVLTGDLEGVEEALYRDVSGRESFKSLLLDDGAMDHDEIQFSPKNSKLANGNHIQNSVLPSAPAAAGVITKEKLESCLKDSCGIKEIEVDETRPPPRKRRRSNSNKAVTAVGENNISAGSLVNFKRFGHNAKYEAEEQQQQSEPLETLPPPKKNKQAGFPNVLPPPRKRKQVGSTGEVQKLLDSVIARQEMFFADLLESMERKEAIRERIREEREDKWRAEERAQLGIFNDAMVALTKEILGESVSGRQDLMNRARRTDATDH